MTFEEFAATRLPGVLRFAGVLTVAHAERAALLAELEKLLRRQRAVLVLRYYEGLSDTEIAEVIGCTPGTVRGYASRALAALRVQITQQAPGLLQEGYRR
jgi:DNA-directed RNA polymerase specialized sigma24 family protein